MEQKEALLLACLEAAVPLWVQCVRSWSPEKRMEKARAAADVIASEGDNLMYRSKKKGKTAEVFNTLAMSLACMSFSPGGVRFMGLHFEEKDDEGF